MPDMHSSIYSIMQDNLKSELKYYPVLGFSDAGFFSKKTLGLCHKPHKTLIIQNFACKAAMPPHHIQNFASQSGLRPPHLSLRFTGQSILLRKTVYDRPVFFGVHTCAVNNFRNSSVSGKEGVRLVKPQNNFPPPPTGIKIRRA